MSCGLKLFGDFTEFDFKKVLYHHLFFYNAEFKVCKFHKRKVWQGGTVVLCDVRMVQFGFNKTLYLCLRFK